MIEMASQTRIDHRALIAGLEKGQREHLLARSDAAGLARLAGHIGAIALVTALILSGPPLWPALIPFQGVLIVFLFTALHETIHETAFRSAWINRAVAAVCGFLILLPPVWFRYFHFAHHRHTHDPQRDPELAEGKPRTWAQYALYLSGLPYWRGQLRTLVGNAAGRNADRFVPARGRTRVTTEARRFLILYAAILTASLAFRSDLLVWTWLLPVVIGQPVLRAYLLAEHTLCPHVANMLENSRTTFTLALVRYFAWNMPYHAEHHAYPAVPFHKLPDFHAVTRAHLGQTEHGYGRFHGRLGASFRSGRSRGV